ncbi:hypothetical protein G6L08_34180 [Agrobacterium rhizogenes]|nr:hypothetical protein [Rhizobium rhizogenes]NTG32192.1 hypothetical protein [Rhizobium rhizogenes]
MTTTSDFIAELIRAANEIGRIDDFERRGLLYRAVITIRDMRETIGIPESRTTADALIYLQKVAVQIEVGVATDGAVSAALLDAAGMIRDLHIVLDTKTKIQIGNATTS